MAPNIAPTRQLYTIDDVAELLRQDFADRGLAAVVEVGEWAPEMLRGEPRVVLGLGRFTVAAPAGHYQPGAWWPVPDGSGNVARPILDDAQRITCWVHAPAVGSGEGIAEGARRATDQLFRQTLRAVRRALASPLREAISGEWPKPEEGDPRYQGFTYGSLVRCEFVLASPILDDAVGVGTGASMETDSSVVIDGITSTPEAVTELTS